MHALVQPPDGSAGLRPAAARVLARQLRSAVEAHQQRVMAAAGTDAVPVRPARDAAGAARRPARGPDDPASHAWLRAQLGHDHARCGMCGCGPTRPVRRQRHSARLRYEFWSADWTPWAALLGRANAGPPLMFDVRPDYGDG